jgi:molybdopterin synthase catalytic subunit
VRVVSLSSTPIDPGALLAAFIAGRTDTGGVVSFTGLVRAEDGVEALELEAYEGFTEPAIAAIVTEAVTRFTLDDAQVVHRIGRIGPGEPVVFVATAARHRRAAFEAADYLMDYLKSRAPFWKKSHEADGARWIEPTRQDVSDLSRWTKDTP